MSQTGDINTQGSLNIGNSNIVATSAGAITAQSDLKIQSSGTDKFAVTASSGAITAHNSFTMKNSSETSTFTLTFIVLSAMYVFLFYTKHLSRYLVIGIYLLQFQFFLNYFYVHLFLIVLIYCLTYLNNNLI